MASNENVKKQTEVSIMSALWSNNVISNEAMLEFLLSPEEQAKLKKEREEQKALDAAYQEQLKKALAELEKYRDMVIGTSGPIKFNGDKFEKIKIEQLVELPVETKEIGEYEGIEL